MKTKKLLILASAALVGGALLAPAGATSALAADEGYAFNEDTDLYLDNLVGTDDRRTFSETGATHQSFAYLGPATTPTGRSLFPSTSPRKSTFRR